MLIGENKICEIVSANKSLNWNNTYTCGCYFNVAIQIKQKKLNWNEISLFVGNNLIDGKTCICFYKRKVVICYQKKLFSAMKNESWQNNFYGNADRD